jgi:GrpB-like predicted nucleotidyltransferase (UPF0157 family)
LKRPDGCENRPVEDSERDADLEFAQDAHLEREAYLERVLIGGREKRDIVIADYDPSWPGRFEQERERIQSALGTTALQVEHIGSTAVPGLAAKPIIDILVLVEDPEDDSRLVPAMASAGYELRVREPGHRMFRTPSRDVHVHFWTQPEVERHLSFRDRLRASEEDRAAYERLKRELARRDWRDMNDYADAKSGLIARILLGADQEAAESSEEPRR